MTVDDSSRLSGSVCLRSIPRSHGHPRELLYVVVPIGQAAEIATRSHRR